MANVCTECGTWLYKGQTYCPVCSDRRHREAMAKQQKDFQDNLNKQSQKTSGSGGGPCWIATAYYGHPNHPEVELMRAYRNNLYNNKVFGGFVESVNRKYRRIGESDFGKKWANTISTKHFSIRRTLSYTALQLFRFVIKLTPRRWK